MIVKGKVRVYPHQKPNEKIKLYQWKSNPSSDWDQENYGVCLLDEGIYIDIECDFEFQNVNLVAKIKKDKAIEELRSNTERKIEAIEQQYQKWLAISAE